MISGVDGLMPIAVHPQFRFLCEVLQDEQVTVHLAIVLHIVRRDQQLDLNVVVVERSFLVALERLRK